MTEKKFDLTKQIVISMLVGVILGWFYSEIKDSLGDIAIWVDQYLVEGVLFVVGKLFVNALKMLVVPLVFVSLVCGVCAAGDSIGLGRIGGKTFALYICTTAIAVTIALILASIVDPGMGANLEGLSTYVAAEPPSIKNVIVDLVPTNPVMALAEAKMLQIIVFSILLGLAINQCGTSGKHIKNLFEDANNVVMKMILFVMQMAPIGVFCLVVQVFAVNGIEFLKPLGAYILTVIIALLLHACGTFSFLLVVIARLNPLAFIRKAFPALLFAFSTASSAATIPVTLRLVEKAVGVRNAIASFTVPMGATINMDGTAIMQGVATVFIAGAYGIDLELSQLLTVVAIATLASVGTAAVPSAGMVTLSMVLFQVGLPTEAIGLILGVDRILDMVRTSVNVCGDMVITTVIAVSEKEFDQEVFNAPEPSQAQV